MTVCDTSVVHIILIGIADPQRSAHPVTCTGWAHRLLRAMEKRTRTADSWLRGHPDPGWPRLRTCSLLCSAGRQMVNRLMYSRISRASRVRPWAASATCSDEAVSSSTDADTSSAAAALSVEIRAIRFTS